MIVVEGQQFHLTNSRISYIFTIMKNGQLGHLYYGKALRTGRDYSHLEDYESVRPNTTHVFQGDPGFTLETVKQEFPVYGKGDFREPALLMEAEDQEVIGDFLYAGHEIQEGTPRSEYLPCTSVKEEAEAETLIVTMQDKRRNVKLRLFYTIFEELDVLTRKVQIVNEGESLVDVQRMMSLSMDLPDDDYEMVHLSGAWARERHIVTRPLLRGSRGYRAVAAAVLISIIRSWR